MSSTTRPSHFPQTVQRQIPFRSISVSGTSTRHDRQRRSHHTCGSLYANCNCAEVGFAVPYKRGGSCPAPTTAMGTIPRKSVLQTQLSHPEISLGAGAAPAAASTGLRRSSSRNMVVGSSHYLSDFGIVQAMGNGAATLRTNSSTISTSNNNNSINNVDVEEYQYLKTIVVRLKDELAEMERKFGCSQNELLAAKRALEAKGLQTDKMQQEIHKLKSVLQQTSCNNGDLLASLQAHHAMANNPATNQKALKKHGVSAQSSDSATTTPIPKHEKDFKSKQLIKNALSDNNFLNKLGPCQMREIIDCMYVKSVPAGEYVIREGEAGAHLYVSADGSRFEVIKDGKVLGQMGPGKAFGELAILYNCTRTASIRVIVESKVWVLDRTIFQQIMMRTGLQRLDDNLRFLRSVPFLFNINDEDLIRIADALEVEFYAPGKYIIRQGSSGDTFFLIRTGMVKVIQRLPDSLEDEQRRILQRGDYFGEQALLRGDHNRTASVIALDPGVECLTLDRESFKNLIGDLNEIRGRDYGDTTTPANVRLASQIENLQLDQKQEYNDVSLNDLEVIGTLGIGGFGRVELVRYIHDPQLTFALKCLKKQHIVDTQQQDHVQNERTIMLNCRSPFICHLHRTYRDAKYVYMLLEACLGGEIWTILREYGTFDDYAAKFVIACVLEAFDYLHMRGIIYRDLKPENLLLDGKGYVKLVDFGFSKRLDHHSSKTWTFCGTPEYVAPETILNRGHDRAVDYWALGVLMYELLTGSPPFTAADPMKTYNLILRGVSGIDFTRCRIGRAAQSLIRKLCQVAPSDRLGYQYGGIEDIKNHKWFDGFDWIRLVDQTLPPPINKCVISPSDLSNFDSFDKDTYVPPDEYSNWDKEF